MEQRIYCYTKNDITQVARDLVSRLKPGSLVVFTGPLGAGKTTLIQHMAHALGVNDVVVSPTYAYVSTYQGRGGPVYHFDLYRLSGVEDFEQMGFMSYVSATSAITFIEWPERIASLLAQPLYADRVVRVALEYLPEQEEGRRITIVED